MSEKLREGADKAKRALELMRERMLAHRPAHSWNLADTEADLTALAAINGIDAALSEEAPAADALRDTGLLVASYQNGNFVGLNAFDEPMPVAFDRAQFIDATGYDISDAEELAGKGHTTHRVLLAPLSPSRPLPTLEAQAGRQDAASASGPDRFTQEEQRRGWRMFRGVKQYCCYGMSVEVGHDKDCQYATPADQSQAKQAEYQPLPEQSKQMWVRSGVGFHPYAVYTADQMRAYVDADRAARAGFVLVPVEPTPEMLTAAGPIANYDFHARGASPDHDHVEWWRAMLAARPRGAGD